MQAVGRTPNGKKVKKGPFPWTASGRAIANGRDEGVAKLLFDDSPEDHGHGRILGGGMVGTHAGDSAWVLYGCAPDAEVKKGYWIAAETLPIQ
jgi:pyruvate/2-oxoglutarate dehydrogenase complex dihydrolipoamide dehydrogenase (E3) component